MMYDMHSNFNLELHLMYKDDFCRFDSGLECIILPDGVIKYAMPSHTAFLERYICKNDNISYEQLLDECPRSYYANYLQWLVNRSGCISVWNCAFMYPPDFYITNENDPRAVSLKSLIDAELIKL